jgi:hypothetical protein
MRGIALCFSVLLAIAGAARAEEDGQYENGESVVPKPDRAYILLRELVPKDTYAVDVDFVRLLDQAALDDDLARLHKDPNAGVAPNVFHTVLQEPYAVDGDVRTYLIAVPAGSYVIAGNSFGAMGTCMCMGTVGFEATPGVITDLGYVLAARDDKPTTIPELAHYVRGKDIGVSPRIFVMTVKPFAEGMAVPAPLSGLVRVPAVYRAAGKFPNYFGGPIARIAPVPGVLDYDADGNVIDLKGKAPAH